MSKGLADLAAVVQGAVSAQKEVNTILAQKPKSVPEISASEDDKWKVLAAVEKSLSKQFGTTAFTKLGGKVGQSLPCMGGDLPSFDYDVIGIGGVPRGRVVEWFGNESGGKTTLALHYVAKEQARGGICAYIDAENDLDPSYMAHLGVDVKKLVVAQPDSLEQAMETVEALIDSSVVTLIVVDSVAALTPQAELDGEMGDAQMGLQARLMGQAMRKLRGKAASHGVTILFINQLRTNLGQTYGNPNVTPGGKALKFFSSLRVEISKVGGENGQIKKGDQILGHKIRLRCVKNKVGIPAKSTEIILMYETGIDTFSDFVAYAISVGAIDQKGSWFSFEEERLGQGVENVIEKLRSEPQLFEKIRVYTDERRKQITES